MTIVDNPHRCGNCHASSRQCETCGLRDEVAGLRFMLVRAEATEAELQEKACRYQDDVEKTIGLCNGLIADIKTERDSVRSELAQTKEQLAALVEVLRYVLSSAVPHPVAHSSMWAAWRAANMALGRDVNTGIIPTSDKDLERRADELSARSIPPATAKEGGK